MTTRVSVRTSLIEAGRFARTAWRSAPLACGLLMLALLVPVFLGNRVPGLWLALPLVVGQVAALAAGWTGLLRAAQGQSGFARLGGDALRILGSILLNSLFLALIVIVLGIVLLGTAGATGLEAGDDLAMATQAAVSGGGWKTLVLLTVAVAALLLVLTLSARLMAAGPATVAEKRVISLAALGWTRGAGVRPAVGLIVVLLPYELLILSVLLRPQAGAWVDWIWAAVLAFVQFPLLAGYATGLWRTTQTQESPE